MDTFYSIDQAVELAKKYYQVGVPFALEGSHGIGKSQALQKTSENLGIGYVDLRLTLLEETDLIGLPYKDNKTQITNYTKPIWLNMIENTGQAKGWLVLEELNRCDRLVRQPALQLLWDRRCLHWNLPEGWLPIATWNPSGDDYETFDLDAALLSRLVIIKVKLCADTWLKWAKESSIPSDIYDYIQSHPSDLNSNGLTPRHWYQASRIYTIFPMQFDLLLPILGPITYTFQQYINNKKYQNLFIKIFENWDEAVKQLKPLLQQQPELINNFNEGVTSYFIKLVNSEGLSESILQALQNYLENIPADASMAVLDLLKRKNLEVTKKMLSAFEGGQILRSKTKSLMKHLFGDSSG